MRGHKQRGNRAPDREKKPVKSRAAPTKEIPRTERLCGGGKAHRDAERIAEHVLAQGEWRGDDALVLQGTHEEFAEKIGFVEEYNGFRRVNHGRYRRALNHLRDYVDADGIPCAGLTTHYKQPQSGSGLWFVDGTRKRESAAQNAIGILRGWAHVEKSQRTERRRMKETLQVFLNSLDASRDGYAYQLTTRVLIKIEEEGAVPDGLMAEFEAFLATLSTV